MSITRAAGSPQQPGRRAAPTGSREWTATTTATSRSASSWARPSSYRNWTPTETGSSTGPRLKRQSRHKPQLVSRQRRAMVAPNNVNATTIARRWRAVERLRSAPRLCQQVAHHLAVYVREPDVAAAVAVGELCVVQPHQV